MSSSAPATTPVRQIATAVSAVFLLVGIAGFIPGLTTHYGDMTFAGHHSGAQLLGIFGVSVLHNAVHLLFGVVGLLLARTSAGAGQFLIGGGVIYLALALYGVIVDQGSAMNFVPIDNADNVLHAGLGVAMLGLGLAFKNAAADRY